MTQYADEPLVSRAVSMKRTEQQNLKTDQQREMDARRVSAPQSAWNQSVAASTDTYMRDALTQVRKSSTTLPTELTMRMGTYIYTNK